MDGMERVRAYYDEDAQREWDRLSNHPFEFELSKRFLSRYIRSGERVLDIGGGPGRYSLFLSELGCDVQLIDLSQANIDFALGMSERLGLPIRARRMNALDLGALPEEAYDHVLLMGPLYHLPKEEDRVRAVREAMKKLRPGGTLACSFISAYAGVVDVMKNYPENILHPAWAEGFACFKADSDFAGHSFTDSYFYRIADVRPFMARFPLQKLHFLSAEGIAAPCEDRILAQSREVVDAWIDLSEAVCEREDLLSYAEHFLYIGRKIA